MTLEKTMNAVRNREEWKELRGKFKLPMQHIDAG